MSASAVIATSCCLLEERPRISNVIHRTIPQEYYLNTPLIQLLICCCFAGLDAHTTQPHKTRSTRRAVVAKTMHVLRACVLLAISAVSSSFTPGGIVAPRAALTEPPAMVAKVSEGDAETFERITLARRATKLFERRAVPDDVLKKVRPCNVDADWTYLCPAPGNQKDV